MDPQPARRCDAETPKARKNLNRSSHRVSNKTDKQPLLICICYPNYVASIRRSGVQRMSQRTPMIGLNALFAFLITSLIALPLALEATEIIHVTDRIAGEPADCNVVYEWSTKLTFIDDSHPGLKMASRVFNQLKTGMTRDVVASKMAYLGFDGSATKLRYLFVVGIGDYRPHHRAELRFRDGRLISIRSPDSLTVPTGPDEESETEVPDSPPDIVETALTVNLNCKGSVSEPFQLAHMGVWHVACGMNLDLVKWALHPIPVTNAVDKWILFVKERPRVNTEMHLIRFDGDVVGLVIHNTANPMPWD